MGTASAPNDPLAQRELVGWTSWERAVTRAMRAQGLTVARKRPASRLVAPDRTAVNVERLAVIHLPRSVTRKSTISARSLPSLG